MGIKNCPCCGGKATLSDSVCVRAGKVVTLYNIKCQNCGLSTPDCETNFEPLSIWNKRISEVSPQ